MGMYKYKRCVRTYNIYTWVLIKAGDTNVNNKYTKCNMWGKSIFPCLWWHVVFPIHNIKNIIKSTLHKRRKSCIDSIQQLQIVVTQNISRTKQVSDNMFLHQSTEPRSYFQMVLEGIRSIGLQGLESSRHVYIFLSCSHEHARVCACAYNYTCTLVYNWQNEKQMK